MITWAIAFFILAIIAAVLGFGGIAGSATAIAEVLFFAFIVMAFITGVTYLVRRGTA